MDFFSCQTILGYFLPEIAKYNTTFPSPVLSKLHFFILLTGLVYALNHVKNAVNRRTKTMNKTNNIVEDCS